MSRLPLGTEVVLTGNFTRNSSDYGFGGPWFVGDVGTVTAYWGNFYTISVERKGWLILREGSEFKVLDQPEVLKEEMKVKGKKVEVGSLKLLDKIKHGGWWQEIQSLHVYMGDTIEVEVENGTLEFRIDEEVRVIRKKKK